MTAAGDEFRDDRDDAGDRQQDGPDRRGGDGGSGGGPDGGDAAEADRGGGPGSSGEQDECRDCRCGECEEARRADEAFRRPYGPGYVGALGAVTDAVLTADALDRLLPLSERWPEPRAVHQAEAWWFRDRTHVVLAGLGAGEAAALLAHVRAMATALHDAAARDERLTTSTAMAWAMAQAGVPPVGDLDPLAWLEATVLVKAFRARAEGDGTATGGPPG